MPGAVFVLVDVLLVVDQLAAASVLVRFILGVLDPSDDDLHVTLGVTLFLQAAPFLNGELHRDLPIGSLRWLADIQLDFAHVLGFDLDLGPCVYGTDCEVLADLDRGAGFHRFSDVDDGDLGSVWLWLFCLRQRR